MLNMDIKSTSSCASRIFLLLYFINTLMECIIIYMKKLPANVIDT